MVFQALWRYSWERQPGSDGIARCGVSTGTISVTLIAAPQKLTVVAGQARVTVFRQNRGVGMRTAIGRAMARATFVVSALLAAGCAADGPNDDAAGVADELGGPDVPLTALTEEVFTVGGWEAEDWDAFSRIFDVHFDPSGNLVVLDWEQGRVTVVGTDGGLLRQISRRGQGPGEFRDAGAVAVHHDGRIVVRDWGHRAFLVFDGEGEFIEQFADLSGSDQATVMPTGPRTTLNAAERSYSTVLHPLPDGRIVVKPSGRARSLDVYDDQGERTTFYRASELTRGDEGAAQGAERLIPARGSQVGEGSLMEVALQATNPGPPVFSPRLWIGVLSDGRAAVADSAGYRVKLLGPGGSVLGTLERPIDPEPVTEEIREAERRRMGTGGLQVVFQGEGGASPAQAEQIRQAMLARITFADEIPVISGLAVDSDDRIWVQRSEEHGARDPTDVLTADGRYVGTLSPDELRLPNAFGPGGLMAYVERDEMEAPIVKVIRLLALER